MITLEKVCDQNVHHYKKYEEQYDTDIYKYQSRIYPSKCADELCWYHIKCGNSYVGSIWLEKENTNHDYAVLGIFISDVSLRNMGYGEYAIKNIIEISKDILKVSRIILRVRVENQRAISCYKKVGFAEKERYKKNNFNVIEMEYKLR